MCGLQRTRPDDDSSNANSGSDFFEQLSNGPVALKEPTGRSSSNGIAKPVKKQAKLSFGSTTTSAKNVLDDASNTEKRVSKTAFDHWSEANTEQLRDGYTGEDGGFQRYLVQTYRQLSQEEKKKWSEMAKQ
ncbi:hypothetical protein AAVH_04393 [Aphelenchoides avenae]|nr:hypothetical protein AAVH_04393 [Aphelenchus avenae]